MARSHFGGLAVVTVALLLTSGLRASAQYPYSSSVSAPASSAPKSPAVANDSTCVVYPLASLGDDPNVGKWIAETIPEMIQPGTWSAEPWRRVSYYAPGKLLVVRHTPAVHAQVAAFLKDFQKALPTDKTVASTARPTPDRQVVPVQYAEPTRVRTVDVTPGPRSTSGYPIPAPLQQPKHLFHLVIRYEGDGISDATVAGLVKELSSASTDKDAGNKPDADPAKGPSLGQLLHFIVRYEGEGIIDSNVAALLKDIYGVSGAKDSCRVPPAYSPPAYSSSVPLNSELPGTTVLPRPSSGSTSPVPATNPPSDAPPRTPSAAPAVPAGSQPAAPPPQPSVTGTGRYQ